MRTFIVKFVPHDQSGCTIHKIQMPGYGDKGFYRLITSWNGFCNGRRKDATKEDRKAMKDAPCWAPTGLYYTQNNREEFWLQDIERHLQFVRGLTDITEEKREHLLATFDERNFPTIEHASLYDFYDYIGFDRKTRRYKC